MIRKILLSSLILSTSLHVMAQSAVDLMQRANEAFGQERYDSAASIYEEVLNLGWVSKELLYNLGTASAQSQKWAQARLYLERARLLDPEDERINHNLDLVKDEVGDYFFFPPYPLFGFIESIHSSVGHGFLSWTLLVFYLLAGCVMIFQWLKKKNLQMMGLGSLILIVLIIILVLFEQTYSRFYSKMSVVMYGSTLYEKPDAESESMTDLNSGFMLRVEEIIGDWAAVEVADGKRGWLLKATLQPLKQPKRKADDVLAGSK